MEKRNAFPFRTEPGGLVDELHAGGPASVECSNDVVDGKTDMVDSRATLGHETANRGIRSLGLEKLHQWLTGGQPGNSGSVGVVEGDFGEAEDVAIEGKDLVETADRDTNVGDPRSARDGWHAHGFWPSERWNIIRFGVGHSPAVRRKTAMANAVAVTDADFEQEIEKHDGLAVVDFWATWCGPCRMIAPILDQLAVEYQGKAKVAKLDVDSNIRTATRFNVRSIPAVLFFKNGKLVDQVIGAVPKPALESKFKQHAA